MTFPDDIQEPFDQAFQGFRLARAGAGAVYNGLANGNRNALRAGIIALLVGLLALAAGLLLLQDALNG